jgi:hypothetical protein
MAHQSYFWICPSFFTKTGKWKRYFVFDPQTRERMGRVGDKGWGGIGEWRVAKGKVIGGGDL